MRTITDGIYSIEGIGSANVFLLGDKDGFSLIDTGIFMMTRKLIDELELSGFDIEKLNTIVLTHCHCDHIGGTAELVRASGASVAAHAADIPYILRQSVIDGPYHGMMVQEQSAMKRLGCGIERVDAVLKDSDVIDILGGLTVINVPGHTPGSIALYEKKRKIMFFGDVIRNNEKRGLTVGLPEKFNFDTAQTVKDAAVLLGFPIDYALFGHGAPIVKGTDSILKELLGQICQ
jgi:glyoxylase-like metal-dependent hydrolase (beta-lactamase superfamily II)